MWFKSSDIECSSRCNTVYGIQYVTCDPAGVGRACDEFLDQCSTNFPFGLVWYPFWGKKMLFPLTTIYILYNITYNILNTFDIVYTILHI